jgi:8-oxo-dGTP diphosphatase
VIRVVAAVVVHDGRIFAAKRPEGDKRGGLWEFPGGKVEPGEDDRTALAREMDEELGMRVAATDPVGEVVHDYGDIQVRLVAYRCDWLGGGPEAREHAEITWVDAEGLGELGWAPADVPLIPAARALLG